MVASVLVRFPGDAMNSAGAVMFFRLLGAFDKSDGRLNKRSSGQGVSHVRGS